MSNDEVAANLERIEGLLTALAILQYQLLKVGAPELASELLFADSGLSYDAIARLVGKSRGAVAKAIQRSR